MTTFEVGDKVHPKRHISIVTNEVGEIARLWHNGKYLVEFPNGAHGIFSADELEHAAPPAEAGQTQDAMDATNEVNEALDHIVLHVEIEEFGDTMEAFIVQKSPDLNGTELLQLVFDNMPTFKFQLHWRDGTTIETLNVRKTDPVFHRKVEVAIYGALQVFIANNFTGA